MRQTVPDAASSPAIPNSAREKSEVFAPEKNKVSRLRLTARVAPGG